VEVPQHFREKAQQASGPGIAQTIRAGLRLVAASDVYVRTLHLLGKIRVMRTLATLKADR